ncbi:hypothetical protein QQF64_007055 [Cirrhinus molitorella]|uniref:Uncharacterized protein n=1 Tax=Cirrhinus molitorella TaxID=172907 RepID=A0ABR3MAZ8_9TELE
MHVHLRQPINSARGERVRRHSDFQAVLVMRRGTERQSLGKLSCILKVMVEMCSFSSLCLLAAVLSCPCLLSQWHARAPYAIPSAF